MKNLFKILFLSLIWGQDCDEGYVWFSNIPETVESEGNCFHEGDLNVLQLMINNSQLTSNPPPNGLPPLELCYLQQWNSSGRLQDLYCNPIFSPMDYILGGDLPEEIGTLTEIDDLWLGGNEFTGSIPTSIIELESLENLDLSSNQLTGNIITELTQLSLDWLFLSDNLLTGSIPSGLGGEGCEAMFLNDNLLTGELSFDMFGNNSIREFDVSNNSLIGLIPESICEYTDVGPREFLLFNNKFCLPFPDCLSDEEIGYQDTSECSELSNLEISYPTEYSLNKSYPNPFNPTISIPFSVPSYNLVSINIYDLKGRLIRTLVDDNYNIGNHIVYWNGSNYSSGSYIVKMKSGDYSSSQVITLVK